MNKKKTFIISFCLLMAFVLWTAAISYVDLKPIGPLDSSVGFAAINGFFHRLIGSNMALYVITDWLGLIPIGIAFGFGILGFIQWIKRKNILKVDSDILFLGGFYIAVMAFYAFFEVFVINYRPVLIDGFLEASYPSSTTMLTLCVMLTAMLQLRARIKNPVLKNTILPAMAVFTAFMVLGRVFSGVHWITDIIGGIFLSLGLVMTYHSFTKK